MTVVVDREVKVDVGVTAPVPVGPTVEEELPDQKLELLLEPGVAGLPSVALTEVPIGKGQTIDSVK